MSAWKEKKILSTDRVFEEWNKVAFQHAAMCQVGLPRKATSERFFERTNGSNSLKVIAGELWDGTNWNSQPLPYGPKPRLIMLHLATQAIRTKSPIVDIGKSIRQFLTSLGVDQNGRNYMIFKKQMEALAACRLTIGVVNSVGVKTINTQPIKSFEAWLHPTREQEILWPGELELSKDFFEDLLEHPVPIPYEAMHKLKDSALDLDVFSWLTHRLCRIDNIDGVLVPWRTLKSQFGQEYKDMRDFKKQIKVSLRYVLAIYQDAKISDEDAGVRLYPSKPPISKCILLVKRGSRKNP